ncbi:MAG: ABC transporter permease [Clostridia bacterium]|nr:MAG: ABC transporter permease [Clostridia bacterium]
MKLRTVGYYFRETFRSVRHHSWMTVAAIITVAISLFILGIFSLAVVNANQVATGLVSELEIAAFLRVDTPPEVVAQVGDAIRRVPGVQEAILVPKEEGLQQLAAQFGEQHDLLQALGGVNPLPDYYRVKAVAPDRVESIARSIERINYVESVNYGRDVVGRLLEVAAWVQWLGMAAVVMLAVAAVALVANTIRLAVMTRAREIAIMKYVGATNWFIRWPFFLQGLFLGLVGAGVAVVCLYWGYNWVIARMQLALPFLPLVTGQEIVLQLVGLLVLLGMVVGSLGSLISVRRFLQV